MTWAMSSLIGTPQRGRRLGSPTSVSCLTSSGRHTSSFVFADGFCQRKAQSPGPLSGDRYFDLSGISCIVALLALLCKQLNTSRLGRFECLAAKIAACAARRFASSDCIIVAWKVACKFDDVSKRWISCSDRTTKFTSYANGVERISIP